MPDDKDKFQDQTTRLQKAVNSFYIGKEPDGARSVIVGSHIVKFVVRKEPTGKSTLIFHLTNGKTHEVSTEWAQEFIERVFGDMTPAD